VNTRATHSSPLQSAERRSFVRGVGVLTGVIALGSPLAALLPSRAWALELLVLSSAQAAALLAKNNNPTREEVVDHMDGNLCRCMTYSRIQKAIMRAAADMRGV